MTLLRVAKSFFATDIPSRLRHVIKTRLITTFRCSNFVIQRHQVVYLSISIYTLANKMTNGCNINPNYVVHRTLLISREFTHGYFRNLNICSRVCDCGRRLERNLLGPENAHMPSAKDPSREMNSREI